jgi:hypothetical protein
MPFDYETPEYLEQEKQRQLKEALYQKRLQQESDEMASGVHPDFRPAIPQAPDRADTLNTMDLTRRAAKQNEDEKVEARRRALMQHGGY